MDGLLTTLHAAMRAVHIGVGSVGLALFWVIVALPKGSRWHVRCGKVFANVTWIIGGSAVISCVWALVDIDSFAALPRTVEGVGLRAIYRFIFAILLYLAAGTLSGAVFGIQVMRKRARHQELRRTTLPAWLMFNALCAAGLIAFGLWHLVMPTTTIHGMPGEAYWIPVFVGIFGAVTVVQEWRYVSGPPPAPREWLYRHVWHMCGTGVAFHTAFLVFGANRLLGFSLPGAWAMLPWIAPPVVGMLLTGLYIRRLRGAAAALRMPSTKMMKVPDPVRG